jgi:hypothetical protein
MADIHSATVSSAKSTSYGIKSRWRVWRVLEKKVRRRWTSSIPCSRQRPQIGASLIINLSYIQFVSHRSRSIQTQRPDTTTCLMHPYFWDPGRRLAFLQDASDRFEIMCRDPRDPHLVTLEQNAIDVVGPDWSARLDKIFVENLGKFRKYDGRSVQDLLRALRNKVRVYSPDPLNPLFIFVARILHLTRRLRNITTRTYPRMLGAMSAPCQ